MNKSIKFLLASNYINNFAYALFGPLLAVFVFEIGGAALHVGSAVAIYSFVSGILMFYFGKIQDKFAKHRRKIVVIGYFILAFGSIAYIFVDRPLTLYIVQVVNAIGVSILSPAWNTVYAKSQDFGHEGEQWAMFTGGNKLFIAASAFIGGILLTYTSFEVLFILIFLLQLTAAFVSLNLIRKKSSIFFGLDELTKFD